LTSKFVFDQFTRNLQRRSRMKGESLCTPKPRIIESGSRSRRGQNRAVPFEEDESGLLVGKPAQCSERHVPVIADHNEPPQPMPDAGKPPLVSVSADAVLKHQVTAFDADFDAVAEQGHNAVPWRTENRRIY
jgi:hypothetical protein